ncbi:MAG: LuxR C-terminal-related transcriptional regulator [Peptococcaceae bacterium]|nr:LuxR C-terminal-related transcriptional regulator [Peptococcaceae bacterium]
MSHLLEEAVRFPAVTMVAGAGCGKTHAVYSFLRRHSAKTAWMQLSDTDNATDEFWEKLIQMFPYKDENPDGGSELRQIKFPKTKKQFVKFAVWLKDQLNPDVKYIFVFDDVHRIHEKSVLRFIEDAVSLAFSNVCTILISRSQPAIETARLDSKGLLARIGEDDLCFGKNELLDYFRIRDIKLSSQFAANIYDATEGWIFAIRLLEMSLKSQTLDENDALSAMKLNIFKLIENEVFPMVSETTQKLLILVSLMDDLPAEFLRTLAPEEGFITEFGRISSFVRYDADSNIYHIHHLFLEFLKSRQTLLTQAEKQGFYSKVAGWYAENHLITEAVDCYKKAGDHEALLKTVHTLPILAITIRDARFLLSVMEELLDGDHEGTGNSEITRYIVRARLLIDLGRFEEAMIEGQTAVRKYEALPWTDLGCHILAESYVNLGFVTMLTCMYTKDYGCARYFEKARHYSQWTSYPVTAPIVNTTVSSYICRVGCPAESGEFEKSIEAFAPAIPYVSEMMNGCFSGLDDLALAETAYYKDNLKDAEKFACQSAAIAREKAQYEVEQRALFFLLRSGVHLGKIPQIRNVLKEWESQLGNADFPNRQISYDLMMGWFYTQLGRTDKLAKWLKDDFDPSALNSSVSGLEIVVKSKFYLADKKYYELLAFLEVQENDDGIRGFLFGRMDIGVLRAAALYCTGERAKAVDALQAVYDMGQSNAIDMPFIELGSPMRLLTAAALKDKNCAIPQPWLENINKRSAAYAKKLLETAKLYQRRDPRQDPAPNIKLSPREAEILVSLSQGLTRKEIAAAGQVSGDTVKSMIKSLYNKLGAVNRADAVRIAVKNGMLKV